MHILLTNDDGIYAKGIQVLRKVISKIARVTVVAPDREKSASGHGITVHKPLRIEKNVFDDNISGYAINGTPADCVKLAVEALMDEPPNLIISGINSGPNLGTDVLYSGTVSAAIEGVIAEIPSIAVSLVLNGEKNYYTAAHFISKLAPIVIERGLPKNTILNVNVPDLIAEQIEGVKITRLGMRKYINCVDKRKDPRGKDYYWLGGQVRDIDTVSDFSVSTDIKAVSQNYISVTPVHFDLTNYEIIENLKKWSLDI